MYYNISYHIVYAIKAQLDVKPAAHKLFVPEI